MLLYAILREHRDSGEKQICVGSSPISGKPYWSKLEKKEDGTTAPAEATISPLLFRSPEYALYCLDIAKREMVKCEPEDSMFWHFYTNPIDKLV